MSEGRELAPPAALPPAGPSAPEDAAEGERREIRVGPEDVFQPEPLGPARWAHHSFFAPILVVVGLSAALLYGLILVVGVLWRALG